MSQAITSHVIERECQGCGKKRKFEMVGLAENEAEHIEASSWLTIIRETTQPDGQGGFAKMVVHACNPLCTVKAATRLFQMPSMDEEAADNIDLSKLKVN
jgi:hypothetical protein